MDESLVRLQGKLKDTSEKLTNYSATVEQATQLKHELNALLGLLSKLSTRQR